ncbi:hypothetical protein HY478_00570 [Candidatus Uhrbacteria bacterium]|nr:hypothetical protein [Candidatus Uhrbacteria bacterium]
MLELKNNPRDGTTFPGERQGTLGLEHIFGSRTRVKLLSLFIGHPENSFYVRELARRIGAQIHSVRRELANLCRLGIIASSGGNGARGVASSLRKRYYKACVDFVLYGELQSLLRKAQVLVEQDLVRRISALGSVQYLAFCGVFLGEHAPTDLLVVGRVPTTSLARLIRRFEQEVGYDVNYTLMAPEEFSYRRDITDRFLYSILEGKKLVVVNKFPFNI